MTFDYRGWGESDSRVILVKPAPRDTEKRRFTAEVIEVREVIDPAGQERDWLNAMHWLQAGPQCDTNRIGIWGSSYTVATLV